MINQIVSKENQKCIMTFCRRSYKCFFLLIIITTAITVIATIFYSGLFNLDAEYNMLRSQKQSNRHYNNRIKTVLFWTKMFSSSNMYFGKSGFKLFDNCKVSNCFATDNKMWIAIDRFDAILFHGSQYKMSKHGIPAIRNRHQKYVFVNLESPQNGHVDISGAVWKNFYNWTMTYRADSDIFRPYAQVVKRTFGPRPEPISQPILNKTKMAAWFVSACQSPSRRELYVGMLRNYIDVDIYGHCGKNKCAFEHGTRCLEMMERDYKFYLAFENSLCDDYVTEKLYNKLDYNIVPVVFGGADYNRLAPPYSFINAQNYSSPEELAKYLLYLNDNDQEYLRYFDWKDQYYVEQQEESWQKAACQLCEKLNKVGGPKDRTVYEDIYRWWYGQKDEKCREPNYTLFGVSTTTIKN